tara:strand:- start:250 stop:480 length:231 start_codon:yes stop_codon:yes gene_type:complete
LVYSGDPRNDTIGAFKPTEDFKQYNTRLTAAIDGDVVTLSGFTSTTYDNKNAATGKTYNLYKITIINILLSYRPAK